jgi:autotransporter-associated beta strand protein
MKSRRPSAYRRAIILTTGIAAFLMPGAFNGKVFAVDGTWNVNANGNWATATSWLGSVIPTGQDGTATFGPVITANRTVTVDTRTIGNLTFNAASTYTLNGGALTLSTSIGTPTINVMQGTGVIGTTTISSTQGFIKSGPGGLQLGASNTGLTGPITVTDGTLRANVANAFNGQTITETAINTTIYFNTAGATYSSNLNIIGFGVAEADPAASRLGAIRLAGTSTLTGTITLMGDAGITPRGNNTHTISGLITGGFGLRLGRTSTSNGASTGTIVLSNTGNNWTGDTTLHDGTVRLGASGVIPNGASAGNVILDNLGIGFNATIADTVLDLNGNNEQINGLSHAAAAVGAGSLNKLKVANTGAAATLTVGDNGATANFGGEVQGALNLTKIGPGTQTLSGANTYTGTTSVSAGTLEVTNASGSGTGTGAVSVAGGATLGGTGTIQPTGTNGVSVASLGIIAPGANGVGTLTLNSLDTTGTLLSLSSGARFVFELNTTGSDKISLLNGAAGDFSFNDNTIGLTDLSGGLLTGSIVLFDGTSNSEYSGLTFDISDPTMIIDGLSIESAFLGQYSGAQLHLVGGDVLLTVVPEPGAAISLMGGLGVLMMFRRRRADLR